MLVALIIITLIYFTIRLFIFKTNYKIDIPFLLAALYTDIIF
jgi:hypothetical protein